MPKLRNALEVLHFLPFILVPISRDGQVLGAAWLIACANLCKFYEFSLLCSVLRNFSDYLVKNISCNCQVFLLIFEVVNMRTSWNCSHIHVIIIIIGLHAQTIPWFLFWRSCFSHWALSFLHFVGYDNVRAFEHAEIYIYIYFFCIF